MKVKSLILEVVFGLITMMFVSGCAYAIHYDGPYEGRVIDADTGRPIEGVVVLGVWYREYPGAAGAVSKYHDAMETLTDKNGKFAIKGLGLKILSFVQPMDVLIFKAGYEYESGSWSSLKKYATKIKWEGEKAIIPLRKLTIEERRKQGTPSFPSEAYQKKKMPLLIKELNKEEKAFNRQPYPEE